MSLESLLLSFRKNTEEKKLPTPIAEKTKEEDSSAIDLFALMTEEKKPVEQTDNKIETNTSLDTERDKESESIAQAPNIPAITIADNPIAIKKERKWRTPCSLESVMEQDEVESRFKAAHLPDQSACAFICLDVTGARKMEIATMKVSQFKLVEQGILLDIVRSKHSAQTQPILLKKEWFGVSEYVIPWYKRRIGAKPSYKLIYHFHTEKGAVISEKLHQLDDGSSVIQKIRAKGREITETENVKDLWAFPNMSKQTLLTICKKVYGSDLFAHYGRARRLSLLLSNPKASVTLAKSFSGIKSTHVIEKYMLTSKKQLDLAIDLVGQDIQKTDQPQ
jgi:integrase